MPSIEAHTTNKQIENEQNESNQGVEMASPEALMVGPEKSKEVISLEDQDFILKYVGPRTESEYIQKTKESLDKSYEVADDESESDQVQQVKNDFERFTKLAELSVSEKEFLMDYWQDNVLGKKVDIEFDVDTADNEEMKKWLYEALMKRASEVYRQLIDSPLDRRAPAGDRKVDESLRQKRQAIDSELQMIGKRINEEQDITTKTQLQLEYLKKCGNLFRRIKANFVTPFPELPFKSNEPKYIEQNQEFICGGAALLGSAIFERDNITQEYYRGRASGHSVDIVRLADGGWCYVDLANGIVEIINPTGEADENGIPLEKTGNCPILEFNNEVIVYQKVPIMKKEDVSTYFLSGGTTADWDKNGENKELRDRLKALQYRLVFGYNGITGDNEIMEKEKQRLSNGIGSAIEILLKDFSSHEARERIDREKIQQREQIKTHEKEIREYLFGTKEIDLNEIGVTGILADCFKACRDNLNPQNASDETWKNKVSDQDFRRDVVDLLMGGIPS
jgi:hypothetical protein